MALWGSDITKSLKNLWTVTVKRVILVGGEGDLFIVHGYATSFGW